MIWMYKMFKDGINLEKVLYKRADNEVFPTISYFMNNNTQPDGFVDGDMNGEYLGLLQGKTNFKDLKYDESMLKEDQDEEDAIFILCEKILNKGGKLYVALGLIDDEASEADSLNKRDYFSENYFEKENPKEYYNYINMYNNFYTAYVKIKEEECKSNYGKGTFGVFIRKNNHGEYQYAYGYQSILFFNCSLPPEEGFYMVSDENPDEYEKGVISIIDKIDIFNKKF